MRLLGRSAKGQHGESYWDVRGRKLFFRFGEPFDVEDDALAEELLHDPNWVSADTGIPALPDATLATILRRGAIGDLIQMRAVIAEMLRDRVERPAITLVCSRKGASLFKRDPLFTEIIASRDDDSWPFQDLRDKAIATRKPGETVYWLDGVVEVDHSGAAGTILPRSELFWRHLESMGGKAAREPIPVLKKLPWEIPHWGEDERCALGALEAVVRCRDFLQGAPTVGIQVRGSGPMKTLPTDLLRHLATGLAEGDPPFNVILIDGDQATMFRSLRVFPQPMAPPDIPARRLEHIEVKAMFSRLDAVVCMDSGPLWMASCATAGAPSPTFDEPVRDKDTGRIIGKRARVATLGSYWRRRMVGIVCLLGPTGPMQRLSHHDLYTEGAWAVRTNLPPFMEPECPSCSEKALACSYRYDCLRRATPSILVSQVRKGLESVMAASAARDSREGFVDTCGPEFWKRLVKEGRDGVMEFDRSLVMPAKTDEPEVVRSAG